MFKRPSVAAVFALALVLSPSFADAQAPSRITVEWENAPLSTVIDAFARFSGRTIVLAPEVGGDAVTAAFRNVEWNVVLDSILARQALIARVDASGTIRVEKRTAPARITVEWQNARLSQVIDAFARFSGRKLLLAPDVADQDVTAAFENVDWRLVLDAILDKHALVSREDASGAIRIEKRSTP